jgi:hypothetical protein
MMISTDFGANFSWTKMPANLKTAAFVVDPTSANSLCVSPSRKQWRNYCSAYRQHARLFGC